MSGMMGGRRTSTAAEAKENLSEKPPTETARERVEPDANASGAGSGGAESGAEPAPSKTAAEVLAATLDAAGVTAEQLIEAARLTNAGAAPADAINQKLDALHVRVTQVEDTADKAFSLASEMTRVFGPYVTKLRHLFDVHFGGKLG